MTIVFWVCVAIGVPIVLFQFVMTLVGLGSEAYDVDGSADFGHDVGGDLGHDFSDVSTGADAPGLDAHADAVAHDVHHGDAPTHAHGSTWLFRILSFRTIVAALAFFGIAGLGAQGAGLGDIQALGVGLLAGGAAMYGVYWLMRGLYMLKAEGTVRIQRAIGRRATVYLRIPGNRSGTGKIQLNLQNRTCEYLAVTSGDTIPTGRTVVVTDILSPETLEVAPLAEAAADRPAGAPG